eukprot:GHVQ01027593.1.p1 GENE.GHVQ01027593.1~~GHVQ01027593.1.p1  ORF type:complete len:625 (-),score=125.46 GHVQ01027593.1:1161-2897(-)
MGLSSLLRPKIFLFFSSIVVLVSLLLHSHFLRKLNPTDPHLPSAPFPPTPPLSLSASAAQLLPPSLHAVIPYIEHSETILNPLFKQVKSILCRTTSAALRVILSTSGFVLTDIPDVRTLATHLSVVRAFEGGESKGGEVGGDEKKPGVMETVGGEGLKDVKGAEAFLEDGAGNIYAALWDARIVKLISDTSYEVVARTGFHTQHDCTSTFYKYNPDIPRTPVPSPSPPSTYTLASHPDCSRPLGMIWHPHKADTIIVADAWRGLLEVEINRKLTAEESRVGRLSTEGRGGEKDEGNRIPTKKSGNVRVLSDRDVGGRRVLFADGVDVDVEGSNIYFTSLSENYGVDLYAFAVLEEPSGKLFRYNIESGNTEVVLSGLRMPNGLTRTHDGTGLLIVQSSANTLIYYLNGDKKGRVEEFSKVALDVALDNIKRHPTRETYVAAGNVRASPVAKAVLESHKIRHAVNSVLPYSGHRWLAAMARHSWTVVEFDQQGNIIHTIGDAPGTGTTNLYVSEGHYSPTKGALYLGSHGANVPLLRIKTVSSPPPPTPSETNQNKPPTPKKQQKGGGGRGGAKKQQEM